MVPRLLRGDETWCQGFSEPGTGSNLGVARLPGRRATDDGWRVTGPEGLDEPGPVRPALRAAHPHRARRSRPTGASPPSSSTWTRPGITVRPIETMHGARRVLRGLLRRRRRARSSARSATRARAGRWRWTCCPSSAAPPSGTAAPSCTAGSSELLDDGARGRARPGRGRRRSFQQLYAFRARSRATQHRLAAGERLGPETSIDKILLATAEQAVFDLVADGLADEVARSATTPPSEQWRSEFLYSRAATIYGGSAEIQRNIVARRLLDLGSGPMMDATTDARAASTASLAARDRVDAPATTLDAALDELGWRDALADRPPHARSSPLFELQGVASATSSALDRGPRRRARRATTATPWSCPRSAAPTRPATGHDGPRPGHRDAADGQDAQRW